HLVAFGDSLTRGLGDLSGKGYIGRVKDALQTQTKKPVVFTNIAVSGQTSAQLDDLLNESEVQGLIKQATLIVFTIGGNDLFGSTNQLDNLSPSTIDAAGQSYKTHLTSIVAKIRAANGTCPVYLVAIYNPFYTVLDPQLQADKYVNQFNQTMLALTGQTAQFYVVPVYDLFQRGGDKFLSSDHFHPSDAGYQRIADRVLQDLDLINN
ncbi:MAG: lysophospholipase, partial [Bacilli bacterium]|nr:lysophospholipase [Bacilli bacterium]